MRLAESNGCQTISRQRLLERVALVLQTLIHLAIWADVPDHVSTMLTAGYPVPARVMSAYARARFIRRGVPISQNISTLCSLSSRSLLWTGTK